MTNPSPPTRRSGLLLALVVGLALALVLAVSVAMWLDDDTSPSASRPSPTRSASVEGGAAASGPTGTAPSSTPITPAPSGSTASEDPDRTTVRTADGWSYQVPRERDWTVGEDEMGYSDASGRVLVKATEPSYFKAGACSDPLSVATGVVGWATRSAGTTSGEVVRNWAHAVAVRDDGTQRPVGKVSTRPMMHSSLEVETSTATVTMDGGTGCLPRWVQVTAASYRGADGARVLVMVREVDRTEGLPAQTREQILSSVRHSSK